MNTMQGKVCLITGGTNGIGKSAAQALASLGATVVIVGREAHKTSQVVEEIRSATGSNHVDALLADLSSQHDVRRLARDFLSKYSQLHVLLNNAGGTFLTRQLSVDGIEMTVIVYRVSSLPGATSEFKSTRFTADCMWRPMSIACRE